ncbi:hypothetical protein TNCV_3378851 [Trichonephila clavipes]|nr:hypothetical protein TNCV_3378851 [Trichonephila clavipes]
MIQLDCDIEELRLVIYEGILRRYLSIASLHAEIVEVEIEVVSSSIVPSGNFAELNRTVTCMVLKANDRRTSCPCHDEFRGPRSDYVKQLLELFSKPIYLISSLKSELYRFISLGHYIAHFIERFTLPIKYRPIDFAKVDD